MAGSAFTLSCDFEGDQWTFFKYPPEDLRALYGIDVAEMNVWRPVVDHVEEQLGLGRLCTVEGDAWFLPDTVGVSYGTDHVKTTIVPASIDRAARDARLLPQRRVLRTRGRRLRRALPTGRVRRPDGAAALRRDASASTGSGGTTPTSSSRVVALTREHLARRPADNPVRRMAARLREDLPWLAAQDLEAFHLYSFGLCRQCGASTELAATFVEWLERATTAPGASLPPTAFREVAEGAKRLQFAMARVVRGRSVDLDGVLGDMAAHWDAAMAVLEARYGV